MSSSPPASSPSSPPSTNSTAPPPSPLSAPPPSNSTSPPPSSLPAPPPSNSTFPAPSSLPAPPPSTPSAPPPSISSPPPPSTPSDIPTPAPPSPSPPDSTTPTPPAPVGKPPPSDHSPPPPKNHPSGRSPSSSSSSSISTPAVVGIAVGAVVIIALLSLLCIYCRKKRRRVQLPVGYYTGPPPPLPPQKDDLYDGGQPQNWQHYASPPPADQVIRLSPQPPSLPPHGSHPPYPPSQFPAPPPPPPPPVSSSSGGSGSVYSEPLPPPSPNYVLGFSKSTFTFEELIVATNGFSDANLLGQGGFGYVHKGVLPTGKEVAIKQLKSDSGQGEREFQAEVEIISRVHHKHLVTLVGYCMSEGQRLLVYEYVPNKTLEFHLHGKDVPVMDWPTRLKIALGAAKGLAYLHEDCQPKIIHRDIKAANILLDFKFEAKVADFGLAKFASDNNTHISTRVMGTFGYLAPEYASSGKLTDKSDVFSFGVVLLELITGQKPVDSTHTYIDDSLVDWARSLMTRAMEDGNYDTLVDSRLGRKYNPHEMAQLVACAASCVRHSARRRPSMSQIVRALEGDTSLEDLSEGIRPGRGAYSYGSSDYDSSQYNEDLKKLRRMALASRGNVSSEYSAPTSEYGRIPSASSSEGQQMQEMEMTSKMKKDGTSQGLSSGSQL